MNDDHNIFCCDPDITKFDFKSLICESLLGVIRLKKIKDSTAIVSALRAQQCFKIKATVGMQKNAHNEMVTF